MGIFGDETQNVGTLCGTCGRDCDTLEIENCPVCRKIFCNQCVYRLGSHRYCGRTCAQAYYYLSDEEEEPEE